jgi:hypothetical protein
MGDGGGAEITGHKRIDGEGAEITGYKKVDGRGTDQLDEGTLFSSRVRRPLAENRHYGELFCPDGTRHRLPLVPSFQRCPSWSATRWAWNPS